MDPTNNPSLSIRPTQSEVRKNLMKDLEKEGYVVITHLGEVLTKPDQKREEEPDGQDTRSPNKAHNT
jgi:ribosomal protein S19E (S16A)